MSAKEVEIVERLAKRVITLAVKMIDDANHHPDEQEGDPKVGGHPAACASCAHVLSVLHFLVCEPFDTFCVKPHGSPVDHSINFLLGLFRQPFGRRWLSLEESQGAMGRLRRFSFEGEPVFQSYHAESDPDSHNYLPSGTVGIPPVVSMYTALAYRFAKDHGHEVPQGAHHWSLLGDSEFREGSLHEAMPEAAERELFDMTWIVDYNRQNLDGVRIPNTERMQGTDADRMERVVRANGWECLQIRHGRKRLKLFEQKGGDKLREVLEHGLTDYEFQSLLQKRDGASTRERLVHHERAVEAVLAKKSDAEVQAIFEDLGGHDVQVLAENLRKARAMPAPTLVVAHTIKGWGLSSFAVPSNHSTLPGPQEVEQLVLSDGMTMEKPYQRFPEGSPEQDFLDRRGSYLREGIEAQWSLADRNRERFRELLEKAGDLPQAMGIDLKFTPLAHTQYVWGQAAGRLTRIATETQKELTGNGEAKLSDEEKRWGPVARTFLTLAPDVGTSTSINPAMDEKIYGPPPEENFEQTLHLRDRRRPALTPTQQPTTRHIRFEIAEANCMSATGAFGKMGDHLGIPFFPVMTIYDFFVKRALDQLYYNLYWGSKFMVVGTPSGVTLSPEGAQHSWKSDFQMPNLLTWEPMYGVEVDWIVSETLRRHALGEDAGRTGVQLRCVTRGLPQKEMLARLRRHRRFKGDAGHLLHPAGMEMPGAMDETKVPPLSDGEILEAVRRDALAGGYHLVDWRGYAGFEPGDNVVNIVAMGAMGTEALKAADKLLEQGIYANVIVCTSADLLVGTLADADGYRHLRQTLGVNGTLYVTRRRTNGHTRYELETRADLVEAAASRIPVVSVADGEIGLLDNIGSIAGVRQIALGVRKASKSGRPIDVYRLHHIDGDSVTEAALKVLEESALEQVVVSPALLARLEEEGAVQRPPTGTPEQAKH